MPYPQKVYKVCKEYPLDHPFPGMWSANLRPNQENIDLGLTLKYEVGSTIKPKIEHSKLFVFRDIAKASEYACDIYDDSVILECGAGWGEVSPVPFGHGNDPKDSIFACWGDDGVLRPERAGNYNGILIPPGTHLAPEIQVYRIVARFYKD